METTSTSHLYIPVLSIAGSDPSGGAGIQQDIKTCEALGCYGMAAVTALTAQSPTHVSATFSTSSFLKAQLSALLDEVRPAAVKVGMMPDAESVEIIADAIVRYNLENVVTDPVIASSSGHLLADETAAEAMKRLLFPLTTVLTPNIPEAEILTGREIKSLDDAEAAAKRIQESYGSKAVLMKGGHSESLTDVLYMADGEYLLFPTAKIDTPNTHGTGCRLSTAIACGLAKEKDVTEAVRSAKEWLTEDLRRNAGMIFPQS